MSYKTIIILLLGIGLFIFAYQSSKPSATPSAEDCIEITGVVDSTYHFGKVMDYWIFMKGDPHRYYILEADTSLLSFELEGQVVNIAYIDHQNWMDLSGSIRHVAQIRLGGDTLLSRIVED